MAWTHVFATGEALGTNGGTSSSFDSTGADTLFLVFGAIDADPNSISDSKGNTWTLVVDHDNGGSGFKTYLYRSDTPATVGSGHTVTITNTTAFIAFSLEGMAGGKTTGIVDQTNSGEGIFGSSVQPGSITPSEDNTVVITGCTTTNDGSISSIDGGFTLSNSVAPGGTNVTSGVSYLIQTSAAAANPTWTLSGTVTRENAVIASFKAAASGGGVTIYGAPFHAIRKIVSVIGY